MGIISYIPKKKEVIDNRTSEGGYYHAICDECGNEFYPKRSNAKYCSRSCLVMAYRKNKSEIKPKKAEETKKILLFDGSLTDLARILKKHYSIETNGAPAYYIKEELKPLKVGETKSYSILIVKRRSELKYQLLT